MLLTSAELLESFRNHLYARCQLATSTVENYVGAVKRALPFIGDPLTRNGTIQYFGKLRRGGTANYAHLTITAIALERFMESHDLQISLGRPPKPKTSPRSALTEIDIGLMIRLCSSTREKALLAVLAFGGIRNSELCHSTLGDLTLSHQILHIRCGKGAKDRDVNLGASCIEILIPYLKERGDAAPNERLFVTKRNHNPMQPQDIRKFVRVAALRAGIKRRVYPHLFRHSLATNLIDRGADIFTVQAQLGHENLATTLLYLHPSAARVARQYHAFVPRYC